MSTRKTTVLLEIVELLFTEVDEQTSALGRLEQHFRDRLLEDVGDINTVSTHAQELRLNITDEERSTVLDYIAEQKMLMLNIDVVENAINERFGWDRFIEP